MKYEEILETHEQICDYMWLLLDDWRQYNVPINDDEWDLLMGKLKKLKEDYING
jgi:hypothetical protein